VQSTNRTRNFSAVNSRRKIRESQGFVVFVRDGSVDVMGEYQVGVKKLRFELAHSTPGSDTVRNILARR
jgi:hypothetical protein